MPSHEEPSGGSNASVEHWMNLLRRVCDRHLRVQTVHILIDQITARTNPAEISCRKGCSFCCHTPVSLTTSEGARILDFVRSQYLKWDRARAEKQSRIELEVYSKALDWEESACVFLSRDGACQVYEARPLGCRKLLAISESMLCDPRASNTPSYLIHTEAEAITKAYYLVELESEQDKRLPTLAAYLARA